MKTNRTIQYKTPPYGFVAEIPKGTEVEFATNLPQSRGDDKPCYWAKPWDNMTEQAESWHRNYGFLIQHDEVTE